MNNSVTLQVASTVCAQLKGVIIQQQETFVLRTRAKCVFSHKERDLVSYGHAIAHFSAQKKLLFFQLEKSSYFFSSKKPLCFQLKKKLLYFRRIFLMIQAVSTKLVHPSERKWKLYNLLSPSLSHVTLHSSIHTKSSTITVSS